MKGSKIRTCCCQLLVSVKQKNNRTFAQEGIHYTGMDGGGE